VPNPQKPIPQCGVSSAFNYNSSAENSSLAAGYVRRVTNPPLVTTNYTLPNTKLANHHPSPFSGPNPKSGSFVAVNMRQ